MGSRGHAPHAKMTPVCLITGSAGRLGTALCRTLMKTCQIAAVYRTQLPRFPSQLRTPLDVSRTKNKEQPGKLAFCTQGDLTNGEDVRRIVEVVLARFDRIDYVINSAADTAFHGKLLELCFDSSGVENQLMTNCVAPINLISTIFQEFWKNERTANRDFNRCVINVSSISGLYIYPNAGQAYNSATKAAINFLTMHLAYELADYSVRVNAICPPRFPGTVPVEKVVAKIKDLLKSDVTGEVVEVFRDQD